MNPLLQARETFVRGVLFVYQELLVKKKISEPKPDLFIVFLL